MNYRRLIASLLARSPVPMVVRRRHRRQLSILMLHGFADGVQQPFENLESKHLDVQRWEAFVGWLSSCFRILPLSEAVACLEQGRSLPDYSVVLTMDDGFRSTHDLAFPVLQKYQVPATIYLATSFVHEKKPIWVDRVSYSLVQAGRSLQELRAAKKELKHSSQDNIEARVEEIERSTGHRLPERVDGADLPPTQRSLDWDQIARMKASGLVEFGSHTHTHRILGRCSPEVVRDELRQSRQIIEEHLDGPCEHFCYPNGTPGDFTNATERLVREAGYRSSVTTVPGWNESGASPLGLRRLGVNNALDLQRFQLMMTGVMALLDKSYAPPPPASSAKTPA